MTSISGAISARVYTSEAKGKTYPDAKPESYCPPPIWDDPAIEDQIPPGLIPDNRPDNVWGKISLPNGQTATIYNGGGVETESTMLDIDWSLNTDEERADAILAKYGGVLKIQQPPEKAPEIGSDIANFWSNVIGNPALADRMLGAPDYSLVPDDLYADDAAA